MLAISQNLRFEAKYAYHHHLITGYYSLYLSLNLQEYCCYVPKLWIMNHDMARHELYYELKKLTLRHYAESDKLVEERKPVWICYVCLKKL